MSEVFTYCRTILPEVYYTVWLAHSHVVCLTSHIPFHSSASLTVYKVKAVTSRAIHPIYNLKSRVIDGLVFVRVQRHPPELGVRLVTTLSLDDEFLIGLVASLCRFTSTTSLFCTTF